MSDKPMLFSGPMVRALLDGRKTQTRRVITWQGPKGFPHFFDRAFVDSPAGVPRLCVPYHHPDDPDDGDDNACHRHYTASPGDRLYVRETWCEGDGVPPVIYRADDEGLDVYRWHPSLHMPRWASRLTLPVTKVRVQRLQALTEEDAKAEGQPASSANSARVWYMSLWDSLNAKRGFGWDANPWVVAITFTVEHANIDDARLAA